MTLFDQSTMKRITEDTPMWKNESDEAIYLTADGKTVKEGDAKANSLLAPAGGELSSADAEKYGLLKGTAVKPEPEAEADEETEEEPEALGAKAKDAPQGTKSVSFAPATKSK